jgi:hypothetical protein
MNIACELMSFFLGDATRLACDGEFVK